MELIQEYATVYGRLEACIDMANSKCVSQETALRRMTEIVAEFKAQLAANDAQRKQEIADLLEAL